MKQKALLVAYMDSEAIDGPDRSIPPGIDHHLNSHSKHSRDRKRTQQIAKIIDAEKLDRWLFGL